jgi:hypothetical protein
MTSDLAEVSWAAIISWGYADSIIRIKNRKEMPPRNFIHWCLEEQVRHLLNAAFYHYYLLSFSELVLSAVVLLQLFSLCVAVLRPTVGCSSLAPRRVS